MIKWIAGATIVLTGIIAVIFIQSNSNQQSQADISVTPTTEHIYAPPKPYTATFEITTFGTKRIFTDLKYHNQSEDIYLQADNPSVIHINRNGFTWADFFATLPMQLSRNCLTTGTGQTFCTNDTSTLQYFLNNKENQNALNEPIQPNDHLQVIYE